MPLPNALSTGSSQPEATPLVWTNDPCWMPVSAISRTNWAWHSSLSDSAHAPSALNCQAARSIAPRAWESVQALPHTLYCWTGTVRVAVVAGAAVAVGAGTATGPAAAAATSTAATVRRRAFGLLATETGRGGDERRQNDDRLIGPPP